MILAGDIGGTKTALGLYERNRSPRAPLLEESYSSQDYSSLDEIIDVFLSRQRPDKIEAACFAIAGPVISNRASVTNLPWTIHRDEIVTTAGVSKVRLINDVQGVACSVPVLEQTDLYTLSPGKPERNGTIGVIAVGTGLGEAFLTWNGTAYSSHPTEGGHTDFGPADADQAALLAYMAQKSDHVSWEIVCSGIGIPNIYDFLKSTGEYGTAEPLECSSEPNEDRTPAIVEAATRGDPPCPLCVDTMKMFVAILGAESGNLALKTMATGGIYLGGGIPPRVLELLRPDVFMASFNSKGRLTPMMEDIPVHVILNPRAALMGAAIEAYGMARQV